MADEHETESKAWAIEAAAAEAASRAAEEMHRPPVVPMAASVPVKGAARSRAFRAFLPSSIWA